MAIDTSFASDYNQSYVFFVLALMLQTVSFFTTFAGTGIFFQGIADIAPLFVAIVIQTSLYLFTGWLQTNHQKADTGLLIKRMTHNWNWKKKLCWITI